MSPKSPATKESTALAQGAAGSWSAASANTRPVTCLLPTMRGYWQSGTCPGDFAGPGHGQRDGQRQSKEGSRNGMGRNQPGAASPRLSSLPSLPPSSCYSRTGGAWSHPPARGPHRDKGAEEPTGCLTSSAPGWFLLLLSLPSSSGCSCRLRLP